MTILSTTRYLAIWVPDWSIHALIADLQEQAENTSRIHGDSSPTSVRESLSLHDPLALLNKHLVVATSPGARRLGVQLGQREAEAQSNCPDLSFFTYDMQRDIRQFHTIMTLLSEQIPHMTMVTPGLMTVPSRGPARYYGGENAAAQHVRTVLHRAGLPVGVAIADSHFAACQAAFHSVSADDTNPVLVIPAGGSAQFLRPLPVEKAIDGEFAYLLTHMGLRTLGDFAQLSEDSVQERYGTTGLIAWHHAHGRDSDTPHIAHGAFRRTPEQQATETALFDAEVRSQVTQTVEFDSLVTTAEELAFACSIAADSFIQHLTRKGLVCTTLRIILTDAAGNQYERSWQHPQYFTDFDVQARLRWQATSYAETALQDPDLPTWNGVTRVFLGVDHWDYARRYEPELWAETASQRLHHQLSRLQGTLGYAMVATARVQGGRLLHERAHTEPWGSGSSVTRHGVDMFTAEPWPGSLPEPRPTIVYSPPQPVTLLSTEFTPIAVDHDDLLVQQPATFYPPQDTAESVAARHSKQSEFKSERSQVSQWSAPWPIREHWWRGVPPTHRLQLTTDNGTAWLLLHRHGKWYAEGRYD